ncbi:MAG: vitamin transporter [Variibacter sp.]|jgi:vitamin B12 transporter|nr:vitamin transporter [Variibacter sp.]
MSRRPKSSAIARTRVALPLAAVLSTAGANTGAHAQSVALPEIVNFASQSPQEGSRVGAAHTVLSGETLREQGIQTVSEALRFVPGLAVSQSGGRGTLTTVSIRGSDARNVLVMIDGIEVNQLGFPGFDFADLMTDDVERIEVIRGPQSGIYGANAHAGVIAIVTRSGKGLAKPAVDARVEAGSRGTVAGSVNVRGASGPAYGSLTFSDYTTRGYNISRFGSEPDGSRAYVLSGKGGIDVGPLNIEGVFRHLDRFGQTDPQDFNFPPGPFYGFVVDGDAATKYKSTAGRLGGTLTLFDGGLVQSFNAKGFDEHTRGLQNGAVVFGADGTRTTLDSKTMIKANSNVIGGESHTFTFLGENRREEYQQLFDTRRYIKERNSVAGEHILDLPTNTTFSTALRHDWNSAFQDVTSWRYAVSQRFPTTGTRLHASNGKGVTDPDVFQLFGSQFNLPNPGLTPEQSIGWDAGVEQAFFDRKVVTDVTYFESKFANKIELSFGPGGFIYRNGVGAASRRGVEWGTTLTPADWLSVTGTYTYTEAITSAGLPEVRRPPHSGSLQATARFLENKAKATVGVVFNGVRKDFQFTPIGTNLIDLPGATVVRAMLSYDIAPWATVYVRGENILNAKYEEIFSYRAPPSAAYAGLRVRFN